MTEDLIRRATEHLDLSKNHESGLIPTATSLLIRDLIAEIGAIRAEGFATGWAAAIEAAVDFIESAPYHWTRSSDAGAIRSIPMPDDASTALDSRLREARAQGLREAAEICNASYGDGVSAVHKAVVERLRVRAEPVAWLCEDQTFKGEYHFERKAERSAFFESDGDWAVTPLYASVTAHPETKVRADIATARAALAEIAAISGERIRRIAQDALEKMEGE